MISQSQAENIVSYIETARKVGTPAEVQRAVEMSEAARNNIDNVAKSPEQEAADYREYMDDVREHYETKEQEAADASSQISEAVDDSAKDAVAFLSGGILPNLEEEEEEHEYGPTLGGH
jgi:hypothetical protein